DLGDERHCPQPPATDPDPRREDRLGDAATHAAAAHPTPLCAEEPLLLPREVELRVELFLGGCRPREVGLSTLETCHRAEDGTLARKLLLTLAEGTRR